MNHYYVNNKAQANGDHEVHKDGCIFMPSDKTYLGYFSTCQEAVKVAKVKFYQVNGCKTCSYACHTS